MKRITCISGLAVMLLISCTIISFFIERQMLPQAILAESRPVEGEHEKILLPSPAVKEDGGGTYVLMAETGDNWEEGLRVKRIPADRLERKGDLVVTNAAGKGRYVVYATKPLSDGQEIGGESLGGTRRDRYLVVPNSEAQLPETAGAGGFALLEKEEGFFLLADDSSSRPFMEERTQELIFGERLENVRVFSLQDAEYFFSCLPLLAAAAFLAFLPGVLWCAAYRVLSCGKKGIAFCIGAFVSALACFCALPLLLGSASLPSSLLPEDNLFDLAHYGHEFSVIFACLGESSLSETGEFLHGCQKSSCLAGMILVCGFLLSAGLVAFERIKFPRCRPPGAPVRERILLLRPGSARGCRGPADGAAYRNRRR